MRLPRGVSADRLIHALVDLGYAVIRQRGSYVRLGPPVHIITVPSHNPLKTGTLAGILSEVAQMRSTIIESLAGLRAASCETAAGPPY